MIRQPNIISFTWSHWLSYSMFSPRNIWYLDRANLPQLPFPFSILFVIIIIIIFKIFLCLKIHWNNLLQKRLSTAKTIETLYYWLWQQVEQCSMLPKQDHSWNWSRLQATSQSHVIFTYIACLHSHNLSYSPCPYHRVHSCGCLQVFFPCLVSSFLAPAFPYPPKWHYLQRDDAFFKS